MKIERQQKTIVSTKIFKSKLMSTDIDNEWNDFLMVRGCNWESSTDVVDDYDGNKSVNNRKNNGDKKCDAIKGGDKQQQQQQQEVHLSQLDSNSDSDQPLSSLKEQQQLLHFDANEQVPVCSPIYISTKTKISYLNNEIDIKKVFWDIPIMPYSSQTKGIVKKQIKFSSITKEELDEIEAHVQTEVEKKTGFVETQIIEHINNPDGRIKFKDQRKINVGLCKKDILNCRCKKKTRIFQLFCSYSES